MRVRRPVALHLSSVVDLATTLVVHACKVESHCATTQWCPLITVRLISINLISFVYIDIHLSLHIHEQIIYVVRAGMYTFLCRHFYCIEIVVPEVQPFWRSASV
jgi:hypothetical protein